MDELRSQTLLVLIELLRASILENRDPSHRVTIVRLYILEARVIGFEPDEQTHALVKRNIDSNGIAGVQVHRVAVGIEDSTVDFFINPDEPGSLTASTYRESEKRLRKKTVVPQVRLSSFLDRKVDLLKVDVEGAEGAVLEDLVSSGAISNIDQMIVEYDHHIDENSEEFGRFLRQLEESGFGYQIERPRKGGLTERDLTRARLSRGGVHQSLLVYVYQKSLASAVNASS
jgi:FkbM family methyltransferase